MLADPRSAALGSNFAGQWLFLRNLPATSPDETLFPQFAENLRQDFKRETELFFESLLRENRNVLDLLSADYTFLNERLARHYGDAQRLRQPLPARDDQRSQPARSARARQLPDRDITSGSDVSGRPRQVGARESPRVAATAAAAKRAGPGRAEPNAAVLTLRERMAQHRANPVCAGCHARMDPIGFALENFDAVGQWRTQEGYKSIDTSASLPSGTEFEGPAGLRSWLVGQPDQIVTT